jgi:tetratricopeptide (TPR) repeat protein
LIRANKQFIGTLTFVDALSARILHSQFFTISGQRVLLNMRLRRMIWISLMNCVAGALFAQIPKPGEVQPSVTVEADASYSYALYLPSDYTPQKRWPILVAFDPSGRGVAPVKLFQAGAEKYGFIVVGSNNSRNFSDPSTSIRLMWNDVIHRFAIDPRRFYTTGLSGGARVASSVAIACKTCVAGVIACAAGLPQGAKTLPETTEWFLATGTTDFNYPEMLRLHENLDNHKLVSRLDVFDGPHGWMPPQMAEDALAWLQLRAMVKGTVPVNKDFIEEEFQKQTNGAQILQDKGNALAASRTYQEIVADFGTLHDVTTARKSLSQIEDSKELQRARKNEKAAVELQARVEGKFGRIVNFLGSGADVRDAFVQLEAVVNEQNSVLRTEQELWGREAIERGIWSAFITATENGQQAAQARNYPIAKLLLQAATVIRPEIAWAHTSLANVYAVTGDKKRAINELRKAVDNGLSSPETLNDKSYDLIREDPAFKELVARLNAKAPDKQP